MKRYYVNKNDVNTVLRQLSRQQAKNNRFYNLSIKPYYGKKYGPNTVVIVEG